MRKRAVGIFVRTYKWLGKGSSSSILLAQHISRVKEMTTLTLTAFTSLIWEGSLCLELNDTPPFNAYHHLHLSIRKLYIFLLSP